MKNDILITVDSKTSNVHLNNGVLGVSQENIQSNLVFNFLNGFVDGNAYLEVKFYYIHHYEYILTGNETGEYEIDGYVFNMPNNIENGDKLYFYDILKQLYILKNNNYELISISKGTTQNKLNLIPKSSGFFPMEKRNEQYILPIKNSLLLQKGQIDLQLKVIQTGTNVPVFKSNIFYLNVKEAINATNILMDEYIDFINLANEKIVEINNAINEVENLNIDVNKSGTTTTVELTKKDGTTKSVEILDGERGPQGEQGIQGVKGDKGNDATINGFNTLNIVEGNNINISQSGSTLTISANAEENVQSDWDQADSTKDDYIKNKPTNLSDFTDDLGSSPVHTHSQYLTEHQDISMKQNIEDNTLNTNNKTVPSAINEVNSIAKGANQALSYSNYQSMINVFNNLANNVYNVGQNVMIVTLNVPDLWISGIESTSQTYTYTTDEAFTTELATNGYVQVGYYRVSALETQKVDLTNYVTFTNYPSGATAGVIKTLNTYATAVDGNGRLMSQSKGYTDYNNGSSSMFISKGTLENVITGKNLVSKTDYASTSTAGVILTNSSMATGTSNGLLFSNIKTYQEYQSAGNNMFVGKGTLENVITGKDLTTKSYVDGLVGDIATALDGINAEVI